MELIQLSLKFLENYCVYFLVFFLLLLLLLAWWLGWWKQIRLLYNQIYAPTISIGDFAKALLTIVALVAGIESVTRGWVPEQLGKFFNKGVESATAEELLKKNKQFVDDLFENGEKFEWENKKLRKDNPVSDKDNPKPFRNLPKAQGYGKYLICWASDGNFNFYYKNVKGNVIPNHRYGSDDDCIILTGKEFGAELEGGDSRFYMGKVFVLELELEDELLTKNKAPIP